MKQDGRDLLTQFRALAPERRPIALQRWGIRRILLAAALVAATVFAVAQISDLFRPAHDVTVSAKPECGTGNLMVLIAQSVPSATLVPCLRTVPAGWEVERVHVQRNRSRFWLSSESAGHDAVEVTLSRRSLCDVSDADSVPSDEDARRYEQPEQFEPSFRSTRYYLFPGGCVTYRFAFKDGASSSLAPDADDALTFEPRASLVQAVEDRADLRLCGAGVRCPG